MNLEAKLKYTGKFKFEGDNNRGHKTLFATSNVPGGDENAATPMEIMLQAAAACSGMDVATILEKKKKTIESLEITASGVKREEFPKIFTKVHLHFILKSPDANSQDLERSIELSQEKYCAASATLGLAGAEVTWTSELIS